MEGLSAFFLKNFSERLLLLKSKGNLFPLRSA
jgi:hypothetical protein